jgi:hypothetical protein
MLSFARWLQTTDFFTYLRESAYAYPVVLSLHMVVILLFGGMILMTDMRLMELAMTRYPVATMINGLRVPKRCGLIFMLTLGFLLFGSKAEEYCLNAWFQVKIALLILIGVHSLVFRRVYTNRETRNAPLAGLLSLILWTGVVCAGRGIGYLKK